MSEAPLVIDVVDNGGQWTHREWRMLRYLGVDTQIIENTTPVNELRELDGLILSGGAARVGLTGELGNCAAYLELTIPILGICAGHQFMARHYGGDARESPEPEFGAMEIELVDGGGTIFAGTNPTQTVWESHNDEVHVVPEGFSITASSPSCNHVEITQTCLPKGTQFIVIHYSITSTTLINSHHEILCLHHRRCRRYHFRLRPSIHQGSFRLPFGRHS